MKKIKTFKNFSAMLESQNNDANREKEIFEKNINRDFTKKSQHMAMYLSYYIKNDGSLVEEFVPCEVNVDVEKGIVTTINSEEIEKEDIYSYSENDFMEALEPFNHANVKVSYEPWKSYDMDDYPGFYSIDVPSLQKAIQEKKIVIGVIGDNLLVSFNS